MKSKLEILANELIDALKSNTTSLVSKKITEISKENPSNSDFILTLNEDNFGKSNLTLLDCIFNFDIVIEFQKIQSVNLNRCKFSKKLLIKASNIKTNEIIIENCHFSNDLMIKNVLLNNFRLKDNYFNNNNFNFSNVEILNSPIIQNNSDLNFLEIENSRFNNIEWQSTDIKVIGLTNCQKIEFKNTTISDLQINQYISSNKISFLDCRITNLLISGHTNTNIISIKKGNYNKIIITCSTNNLEITDLKTDTLHASGTFNKIRISDLRNLNTTDAMITITSNNTTDYKIENVKNFDSIKLISQINTTNDVIIKHIETNKLFLGHHDINSNGYSYNFNIYFENIKAFSSVSNGCEVCIENIKFQLPVTFKNCIIGNNLFNKSEFRKNINFIGTTFKKFPNFYSDNFKDCLINFISCNFEDFKSNQAESAYRLLKNNSIKTNYEYGEHLFTALELRSRQSKLQWNKLEKWIGLIGWEINNLGESLSLPLKWLSYMFFLCWVVYYNLGLKTVISEENKKMYLETWVHSLLDSANSEKMISCFFSINYQKLYQSLTYSFLNTFVLLKFTFVSNFLLPKNLFGVLIGIVQSLLSSILIYLLISGIKKRFRQK